MTRACAPNGVSSKRRLYYPWSMRILSILSLTLLTSATVTLHALANTDLPTPLTASSPLLVIANRSSHTVMLLDPGTASVIHQIEVGAGPHLLSNVSAGRVLVTGYGEFPAPHDQPVEQRPPFLSRLNSIATLIDTATGSVIWQSSIDQCARPHASWIVGDRAFVTCEDEMRVAELDLATARVMGSIDTRQAGSHVLAYEPEANILAVSNTDAGSVTLIDLKSRETRVVALGSGSEGSLVLDGQLWVANGQDGSLSVVDPPTGRIIQTVISVCGFPIALAANNETTLWIACFASSELVAVDRTSYRLKARIPLSSPPLNLLLHPEKPLAYASLPRRNAVAEIDLEAGQLIREIPVGIEPDGLRWAR